MDGFRELTTLQWVADAIQRDGIYEHQILQREYPFLDNKRDYKFCSLARDIMRADPVVLELRPYTLMDLQQFTEKNMFSGWVRGALFTVRYWLLTSSSLL